MRVHGQTKLGYYPLPVPEIGRLSKYFAATPRACHRIGSAQSPPSSQTFSPMLHRPPLPPSLRSRLFMLELLFAFTPI
jgi:hypothetical protein